jgi:acetyl esterase
MLTKVLANGAVSGPRFESKTMERRGSANLLHSSCRQESSFYLRSPAAALGIDPKRVIVAGESGGGNLTLATGVKLKQEGQIGRVKSLYALCPFIASEWPLPQNPSSIENNGILMNLHNNRWAMGYGIEAFRARNPPPWPGFATAEDVRGLPRVVISVNECDPLRDEGINFYRLVIQSGGGAMPSDYGHYPRY